MILTHFLALIAAPPAAAISPDAATLALDSSMPLIGSGRLDALLLPAARVRAAPAALAIRER